MPTLNEILKTATVSLVDVRTPAEYNTGHIAGAVNIPLDELSSRLDEIKAMHGPVVCYCRSGARSGMAVSLLKQYGITQSYNGGGIDSLWQYMN